MLVEPHSAIRLLSAIFCCPGGLRDLFGVRLRSSGGILRVLLHIRCYRPVQDFLLPSSAEGLLFDPRVSFLVELCRWSGLLWPIELPQSAVCHGHGREFEPQVSGWRQAPLDDHFHLAWLLLRVVAAFLLSAGCIENEARCAYWQYLRETKCAQEDK